MAVSATVAPSFRATKPDGSISRSPARMTGSAGSGARERRMTARTRATSSGSSNGLVT